MKTVAAIEKTGRQVILAGLGVVGLGKDYAIKRFDLLMDDFNGFVNDLLIRGEEVDNNLAVGGVKDKVFRAKQRRIDHIRKQLGLGDPHINELDNLSHKVDELTKVINKLAEQAEKQSVSVQPTPSKKAKVETAPSTTSKPATRATKPSTARKTTKTAASNAKLESTVKPAATKAPASAAKTTSVKTAPVKAERASSKPAAKPAVKAAPAKPNTNSTNTGSTASSGKPESPSGSNSES